MNDYYDKEYIRQLQEYLYYISLTDPSIPRIMPDGIYGKQTRNAVSAFQRSHGSKITGDADMQTWEAIKAEYERIIKGCETPAPLYVFPGKKYVISVGEKSETVSFIQLILQSLDTEYHFGKDIKVTGEYSEEDAAAVKDVQCAHGLSQTGSVNCITWNCLASDYKTYGSVLEYKRR